MACLKSSGRPETSPGGAGCVRCPDRCRGLKAHHEVMDGHLTTTRRYLSDGSRLINAEAMDDLTHSRNIFNQGNDFIFIDSEGTGTSLVPRWHLHLCLEYSKQVRTTVFANRMPGPAPIGYDLVARTYNAEPAVKSNFSQFNEQGRWPASACLLPEPSPQTFFGNFPPIPPPTATQVRSAEIANVIVDRELARQRRITKIIEERKRRNESSRDHLLTFGPRGRGTGGFGKGNMAREGSGTRRNLKGGTTSVDDEDAGPSIERTVDHVDEEEKAGARTGGQAGRGGRTGRPSHHTDKRVEYYTVKSEPGEGGL